MCVAWRLLAIACLAVAVAFAQAPPRELPRDRTDQLRSLGDPGPIPSKRERELTRKMNQQQKEWKRSFERDWKGYLKSERLKYKAWTTASSDERTRYQDHRKARGLAPVPSDLMQPIHPRL